MTHLHRTSTALTQKGLLGLELLKYQMSNGGRKKGVDQNMSRDKLTPSGELRDHTLALTSQCSILGLHRSCYSFYHFCHVNKSNKAERQNDSLLMCIKYLNSQKQIITGVYGSCLSYRKRLNTTYIYFIILINLSHFVFHSSLR